MEQISVAQCRRRRNYHHHHHHHHHLQSEAIERDAAASSVSVAKKYSRCVAYRSNHIYITTWALSPANYTIGCGIQ